MSDESEPIKLEGREFTVSASEKVSTGDYENYEPHVTIKGEIPAPESKLDQQTRTELRRELTALHHDLQGVLEVSIQNRLRAEGHEDWPAETEADDD